VIRQPDVTYLLGMIVVRAILYIVHTQAERPSMQFREQDAQVHKSLTSRERAR